MYAFTWFICYIVRLRVYVTVNSVVYASVACVQAKSICISTYDGIKGGSALVMQVKCMVSGSYTIFMLDTINALIPLWLLAR